MKKSAASSLEHTLTTAFVIILSICSIGWSGLFLSKPYYNASGTDENGNKVYAGKVPIDSTRAYNQFKMGPRSEMSKLHYLLDRLGELEGFRFRFGNDYYDKEMARFGMDWLISHRYKRKQNAREFLRTQNAWLEVGGDRLLIRFPDGKLYHAIAIILNELDLLEETYEKEKTVHFLRPVETAS